MDQNRIKLPPALLLFLVAVVMSFAISGVYMLTRDTIEAAALTAQAEARTAVMADAVSMTELPPDESGTVDYCYEAYDGTGQIIGYVCQVTATGFGGEIEITVGMDMDGAVTAISVGGANFSETSGLGAKTRESAFTDQFKGVSGMLVLKQNIDSVTGASISSGAVVSGVNRALVYMTALLPQAAPEDVDALPLSAEEIAALLPGETEARWMGGGSNIDGWWQADSGYIVQATGFGEGPIVVKLGFTQDGTVTGILIGDENFMESEGMGARVLEETYWSQFIGVQGPQTYGENGIDAVSGATVTSEATLGAINVCLSFDPATAGAVPAGTVDGASGEAAIEVAVQADPNPPIPTPEPTTTPEPTSTPAPVVDAATAATGAVAAESVLPTAPTPTATPEPEPEAAPAADATTAATGVVEATPTPTPAADAATGASIVES